MAATATLLGALGLMYVTGRFAILFWVLHPEAEHLMEYFWCFMYLIGTLVCGVLFLVVIGQLAWLTGWSESVLATWYCFLTFFPLFIANQCPGWARDVGLPGARVPISERTLGNTKTRGGYYAVLGAFVAVGAQISLPWLQSPLVDYYNPLELLSVALASGFGAVWGDHVKSYLKRRKDIEQGEPWWPWDQDDCVIGTGFLLTPLFIATGLPLVNAWLGYLILMPIVIHPIGNTIWYKLGKRPRIA